MSLSAIASAVSTVLPTANFHPHGRRKGASVDKSTPSSTSSTSSGTGGITIGQLPVGASTPLFNNILQSLQQTVGAATAVSGTTPAAVTTAGTTGSTAAAGSSAASGSPANVQAFVHTLFQALKQDGLGASGSTTAAAPVTVSSTAPAATGGQYQANLVSSLQTLIRQVGSASAGTSATANLNAAYQNLVSSTGAGGAAASAAGTGASSVQSSSAGLQNFLSNLLQNLQSGGVQSLSGVGNTVNAKV